MGTEDKYLFWGKEAYDGYGCSTNRLTHDGKPMLTWEELRPAIQQAWCAAAVRVVRLVTEDTLQMIHEGATAEGRFVVYRWEKGNVRGLMVPHGHYATVEAARKVETTREDGGWGAAVRDQGGV